MKTLFVLALALLTQPARAADSDTLPCRVKEQKGRQTESYSLRLQLPSGNAQFNLRLYPKVVAELSVETFPGEKAAKQQMTLYLLDYAVPDAETIGDMIVGRMVAYDYLDSTVKLDQKKDHTVDITCYQEE